MFDNSLHPGPLLKARASAAFAAKYFGGIDASIEAAAVASGGRLVFIRQAWVPFDAQSATARRCCCAGGGGCVCSPRDALVLRYRGAMPVTLTGLLPREDWEAFVADLDVAMSLRDGCISKGCAITVFVLLFYLTIVGIFFYMCAEYGSHRSATRASRAAVAEAIARANARWAARGLRVTGRWHADRAEDRDEAIDLDGNGIDDFPLICVTLPEGFVPPPPPRASHGAQAAAAAAAAGYYGGYPIAVPPVAAYAYQQPPPSGACGVVATAALIGDGTVGVGMPVSVSGGTYEVMSVAASAPPVEQRLLPGSGKVAPAAPARSRLAADEGDVEDTDADYLTAKT